MPKNKKPAGGRAQNFEPRYGKKTSYQDAKRRPGPASAYRAPQPVIGLFPEAERSR